ncbi:hypothetical protein [Dyadobacter frigoris]|uniref:DUF3299 domain-containing protein n=1 Tax=Dyadobacter frigoris TaxID=2576211 RepID=A0A4V6BM06_9BACT|nr:hypothetical protein [Dyadobacter frigoris]TKT92343.1 hypothetical protein FDK13_10230 [Dyadobacter frigoris]GLU53531.1 hypothetical protein Dfri01_29920 [Dyadobacter frigoris]
MILKKTVFLFFFLVTAFALKAQPPTHVPLMTSTWKLIAERSYKKNKDFKMVPTFPAKLEALQNKLVELPGYMIPINADVEHKEFMLAVVPMDQCPYCGQGDIPSMIEVKMTKELGYTDKPIKIRGKLLLNKTGDLRSEIFLLNAELIK